MTCGLNNLFNTCNEPRKKKKKKSSLIMGIKQAWSIGAHKNQSLCHVLAESLDLHPYLLLDSPIHLLQNLRSYCSQPYKL